MTSFARLVLTITFALLGSGAALAQASADAPYGLDVGQAPSIQVGAQYQATHANAPPSGCGCFWLQGGGAQLMYSVRPRWSAAIDLNYSKASNINATTENLSLFNYTFGPRYTLWGQNRWSPYGQALVGISKVSSNYAIYGSGKNSLAAQAGLGVNYFFTPHYSIIPFQVDWVHSQAVNNVNSRQNNYRLGFGFVYRIGPH